MDLLPPRNPRETFLLLARLEPGASLEDLLDAIDWTGVTPQQVAYAVLGRLPQEVGFAHLARTDSDPRSSFAALLLGEAFQSAITANLLGAFPEKPRRFFVHVPRCGGTSLGETLATQACTVPDNALGPDWSRGRAFLDDVAAICGGITRHEAIHVSGHYSLRSLVEANLLRFGDSIWTSVRPPRELLLSFVNYILTVLEADAAGDRPDTRRWAELLGLGLPLASLSQEQRHALLPRMIADGRLLPRDPLCHFLGDGTAASALDLLAAADVEVIDSARLDQWQEQRLGIAQPTRHNASRSFLRWSGLDPRARGLIDGVLRQDIVLHRAVAGAIRDGVSARGRQIAVAASAPVSLDEGSRRLRRAARPILRDARFLRLRSNRVGWADPPLNYRTIETTLRLPFIDTRIRVRYARRDSSPPRFAPLFTWLGARFGRKR